MRQWKKFLPARMDVGCGGKPRLSAQVEIIFLRKRNYLSKRGKRGMITATRQIIRQDMGDSHSPMPLCRRDRSYTIAFATPAPIITVFPSFFNSHFLTSYHGGLFYNTGFVSVHMRCGVIISCTAFCLSRRDAVRRDAGINARPVRGQPGEILYPYDRSRREGEVW